MIRKKQKQEAFGSLYRHIIPVSLKEAWRMKWLWILALFAGMTQTGGVYDAVFVALRQAREQGSQLLDTTISPYAVSLYERIILAPDVFQASGAIISVLVALAIIVGIVGFSLISQGALVFGHGGRIRGRMPTLQECLTVGSRYLPRIFFLNIITGALLWLARFLMLVPVALANAEPSIGLTVLVVIGSVVYIVAAITLTAVHFFSLNALILQDAHVAESLVRGWNMFRRSKLHVLEIGVCLFVISAALLLLGVTGFLVMVLPLFLVMLVGATLNVGAVVYLALMLGYVLFFGLMLIAGMVSVSFQYAAWHHLFLRMGEGGAVPKIHRWIRWLIGSYSPSK